MNKKLLILLFFAFSASYFSNSAVGVGVDENVIPPDVLIKMQKFALPLKTLSLEFTREHRTKSGVFVQQGTYLVKADIGKNLLYCESRPQEEDGEEIVHKIYLDKTKTTYISSSNWKNKKRLPKIFVTILNANRGVPSDIRDVFEYNSISGLPFHLNSLMPTLPMFSEKGIEMWKPVVKIKKIGTEDVIQISSTPLGDKSQSGTRLTFSRKTGCLLERENIFYSNSGDSLKSTSSTKYIFSDYFENNGVLFPTTITCVGIDGSGSRISINKKSASINVPLEETVFCMTLPAGASVNDEIRGITYITPNVGAIEPDKTSENILDSILEQTPAPPSVRKQITK